MSYVEFENRLWKLISAASMKARYRFAHETLLLLYRRAETKLASEMTDDERKLLANIIANLDKERVLDVKEKLRHFDWRMYSQSKHEFEYSLVVAELLEAIENWASYRAGHNPEFIERIGLNLVATIECGRNDPTATDVLAFPGLREEHDRQARLLTEGTPK